MSWLEVSTSSDQKVAPLVVQAAFYTKGQKDKEYIPEAANCTRPEFLQRHFKDWKQLAETPKLICKFPV